MYKLQWVISFWSFEQVQPYLKILFCLENKGAGFYSSLNSKLKSKPIPGFIKKDFSHPKVIGPQNNFGLFPGCLEHFLFGNIMLENILITIK